MTAKFFEDLDRMDRKSVAIVALSEDQRKRSTAVQSTSKGLAVTIDE